MVDTVGSELVLTAEQFDADSPVVELAGNRRTVASSGGWSVRRHGSARTPSAASTPVGASAAHSPIAVNERAPARTAHTATARTATSR